MPDSHARACFIAAANTLAAKGEGLFTLNELYAESGLTRADFRRSFGSKAALMEAAVGQAPTMRKKSRARGSEESLSSDNRWIERRFRIIERAISSLESQIAGIDGKNADPLPNPTDAAFIALRPPLPFEIHAVEEGIEAPPLATVQGENAILRAGTQHVRPDRETSDHASPETPDDDELDSYWTVAREQLEVHPYKTLLVFLVAITTGIFIGILTSTVHADPGASAAPSISPKSESAEHPSTNSGSLLERANRGDTVAQRKLALAYLKGVGMQPDFGNGLRWASVAASRGDADAAYLLGSLYETGMLPDLQSAAHWYFEAAKRGNVKAMHNLGIALLNGSGVEKDDTAAAHWFEKAAGLGYRDSQFDLAVLYERGEGVNQNALEALRWYEKAASVGDSEAAKRAAWLEENVPGLTGSK